MICAISNIRILKPHHSKLPFNPALQSYFYKPSNSNFSSQSKSMGKSEVNATGLTPDESKKLKSRTEREDEKVIIRCLKDLYTCNPSESAYEMYAEKATFHDPVSIATPLSSIKSQFNGMPKVFSSATIDKFEVLESPSTLPNPPGPDQFTVINQDVTYFRKGEKFKTVNSLLTLERDPNGKVIKHTEEWSHDKQTDANDGIFGTLNEWRKKLTANVIDKGVSDDPSKAK